MQLHGKHQNIYIFIQRYSLIFLLEFFKYGDCIKKEKVDFSQIQFCEKCKTCIEKDGGCNHMSYSNCRYEWLCHETWGNGCQYNLCRTDSGWNTESEADSDDEYYDYYDSHNHY